jgi:predicted MPP superfamily phosphohydrolase
MIQIKYKIIFIFLFLAIFIFAVFMFFQENSNNNESVLLKEDEMISVEPLKIGFISDAHCYSKFNKETGEWNLNWRCNDPLNFFVEKMNKKYKPDFVIENGDLTDGRDDRGQEVFVEANNIFNKVNADKYHVLGNHETRNFVKNEWLNIVGYEKPYYYFDANGYRIIILDGNNKPATEEEEGSFDTSPEIDFYPGFIDSTQMDWLKNVLKNSKRYQKIVFVHQPVFSTDLRNQDQLFIGGEELRNLFSDNEVRAVFSGHIERFCHLKEAGVDYYTIQGFWKDNKQLKRDFRFKDTGVFSEISIDEDDISIVVNYNPKEEDDEKDQGYLEVNFSEINNNCLNGETLLRNDESDKVE